MLGLQGFQEAGFHETPTAREIGVRQALHVYQEESPAQWAERNTALVQRRSVRGAFAQFVGQIQSSDRRREAVLAQSEILPHIEHVKQQSRAILRFNEQEPSERILSMLSPFQRRMLALFWKHEGIPLSHEFLNASCSRSKNEERKEHGGGKVLHAARRTLRKKLRELGIGELFTIQESGVLFLSPERSGLPLEALHALKGSDGIHGLHYDVLRQYEPDTAPYAVFAQTLAEVGRGKKNGEVDPQDISKRVTKLNKIDTGAAHFVVQPEQKQGYRLIGWNEIPEAWVQLLRETKLQVRDSDVLIHLLSREGELVSPEEIVALIGKPNTARLDNSLRTAMFRLAKQVKEFVEIDAIRAKNITGKPIVGYRATALDPELIVRPLPIQEKYVRLVRQKLVQASPAMEADFAQLDPGKYTEWLAKNTPVETAPTTLPVAAPAIQETTPTAAPVIQEAPPVAAPSIREAPPTPPKKAAKRTPILPPTLLPDVSASDEDGDLDTIDAEEAAILAAEMVERKEKEAQRKFKEEGDNEENDEGEEEEGDAASDLLSDEDAFILNLKLQGVTPTDPTNELPGSPRKIAIMRWRMESGIPPHNPLDWKDMFGPAYEDDE